MAMGEYNAFSRARQGVRLPFMTPLCIIDAFTGTLDGRELRGNPAAVMLLPQERDGAWLQSVAQEMNLSETAFLRARAAPDEWDLRWFTPQVEVRLCGHATLAAARFLWDRGAPASPLRFHTLSGVLVASQGQNGEIALDFPSQPSQSTPAPPQLIHALGLKPHSDPVAASRAGDDWLLLVAAPLLRAMRPDFALLRALTQALSARGVIVTARGAPDEAHDFLSRFFAPAVGIDEDPVTGSAHAALAPFWSRLLSRTELVGFQASPRGGLVRLKCQGDRVQIGGQARFRLRGEWCD